jgi:hypothetical protein
LRLLRGGAVSVMSGMAVRSTTAMVLMGKLRNQGDDSKG